MVTRAHTLVSTTCLAHHQSSWATFFSVSFVSLKNHYIFLNWKVTFLSVSAFHTQLNRSPIRFYKVCKTLFSICCSYLFCLSFLSILHFVKIIATVTSGFYTSTSSSSLIITWFYILLLFHNYFSIPFMCCSFREQYFIPWLMFSI